MIGAAEADVGRIDVGHLDLPHDLPAGEMTVMQPVISVATQMLPEASTARLSKR